MTVLAETSPERDVLVAYPGVSATAAGRLLGRALNCVPIKLGPATLSQWILGLPLAPLGAAIYFWQKAFGLKYRLTDRRLIVETSLTGRQVDAAELADVADAEVDVPSGSRWFRAGDLTLRDRSGARLLTVRGVPHVENFAARLAEMKGARASVDAAAARIAARPARA
ncbi:PH domain-containing protein [Alienimonas sp. DA493]|uniref:PH domain-containing protein n=1 Tax=Alienimonas sp. DA493 TaxID=3373605 RepID=UPI003754A79A